MATYRHPIIAREGWLLIGLAILAAIAVVYALGLVFSLPVWGGVLVLLFLFRDPPRDIPAAPLGIVSPVDGLVTLINNEHDVYLDRDAIRLTIKINRFGVYSIRSPMEGKVMQQWFGRPERSQSTGARHIAAGDECGQWIKSDEDDDVVISTDTDIITRRPGCFLHSGERVGQGQRCGFIHFGGSVDVFIPPNSRVDVKINQRVLAGSDIIATLVHK